MRSSVLKLLAGFLIGASVVGGFAVAQNSQVPIVKACVDNKTSALFASSNGSCSKGRTAIDIGSTGANVKSIAQLVSPSVVSISVTTTLGGGTGSGSIYQTNSNNSYILTNNHVIEGAVSGGTINVELNNGDVVPATIVGRDPAYDLAVLQIKRGNMPAINFGDSTSLSIGDPVVAFGSPLGLSGTVTSGIVSAINRPVTTGGSATSESSYINAVQTDAAINPGNSGGPLTDSQGRMIGINSAIATLGSSFGGPSGSIGLGFAIPINQAKKTADQLIKSGKATYPIMGLQLTTNYSGNGALVATVSPGLPAEKVGLLAGDILTAIDGKAISSSNEAIIAVRTHNVGDKVSITFTRNGVSKKVSLTLVAANN